MHTTTQHQSSQPVTPTQPYSNRQLPCDIHTTIQQQSGQPVTHTQPYKKPSTSL
uniref:Uncharacterized protein n=1 Tax=Arion vulgaris TaxID=1028688 RepID=A0A0B7B0Z3_9EUPU